MAQKGACCRTLSILLKKPSVEDSMSSPALRGSAEWSARRELALLLGLTRGNLYAAQRLWLRKERIKAEASQVASAGAPQASQQPAGCQAKPATVEARGVPKPKTAAQLARSERGRERLRRKHLARVAKVAPKLQAWLRRARANLERRGAPAPPATPTGPSVAVPESGAELPPFRAEVALPAPSTSSTVAAQPQPALALAAPPPPSQPPPSRRWPPPPGRPSTPASCRTTEGRSATR